MTGEQKPGGLEVVAWRYRTALHRAWHFLTDDEQAKFERDDGSEIQSLTPAEPAEARIRELEADRDLAWGDARNKMAAAASANARATAAEAKLARAVEGLERIRSEADTTRFIEVPRLNLDRCADIAATALAALQEAEGKA